MAPVLADGRLVIDHGGDASVVFVAINGLTYADRLDDADELIAQALADVRRRGSLTGYVHISTFRAQARLRRGLVSEAEADARGTIEPARLSGGYVVPGTFALLVEALVERDDLEAADAELRRSGLPDVPPIVFPFTLLLHSRAVLRLRQGRARGFGRRSSVRRAPGGTSNPQPRPDPVAINRGTRTRCARGKRDRRTTCSTS